MLSSLTGGRQTDCPTYGSLPMPAKHSGLMLENKCSELLEAGHCVVLHDKARGRVVGCLHEAVEELECPDCPTELGNRSWSGRQASSSRLMPLQTHPKVSISTPSDAFLMALQLLSLLCSALMLGSHPIRRSRTEEGEMTCGTDCEVCLYLQLLCKVVDFSALQAKQVSSALDLWNAVEGSGKNKNWHPFQKRFHIRVVQPTCTFCCRCQAWVGCREPYHVPCVRQTCCLEETTERGLQQGICTRSSKGDIPVLQTPARPKSLIARMKSLLVPTIRKPTSWKKRPP